MLLKRLFGLVASVSIVAVVLTAVAVYADYRDFLDTPLTAPADGGVLTVAPGDSINGIAARLQAQGVLRSAWYLQAYARLSGQAGRIKAGEYALDADFTPPELLARLVAGRVIQYSLTIVEGWTFRQMLAAVQNHPKLVHTLNNLTDQDIMARLGHPDEHPEGRFFPDTYHFPAGTRDIDFLQRAYDTMAQRLAETWAARTASLPIKTPYEALILASIIEKETAVPDERRAIAGVFTRRLQRGMLLQTDPTVIYGMGTAYAGNIRRSDLKTDTPYNTYTRKGLPPTPIALPGAAALAAAVDPAAGDSLYFVARGDGSHVFSNTLAEHNRAVRRYQLQQ